MNKWSIVKPPCGRILYDCKKVPDCIKNSFKDKRRWYRALTGVYPDEATINNMPPVWKMKDIIEAQNTLSLDDFKRAIDALRKASVPMTNLVAVQAPDVQEKETTMYNEDFMCRPQSVKAQANVAASAIIVQQPTDEGKKHALQRLYEVLLEKNRENREHFGLNGKYPKDHKEAAKWFKEGNYRIVKGWDQEDDEDGYRSTDLDIEWGKEGPDHEGFKAADKALDSAYADAKDTISIISDEAKRLETLNEFKSKTFH